jgi:hypothetical protein
MKNLTFRISILYSQLFCMQILPIIIKVGQISNLSKKNIFACLGSYAMVLLIIV